ncbi:MAG: YeeE/YedE family protein [Gammaproteobacteria bacterium]|nr:YeeE/YedE family protein [Gammaproteobacteria bacterium]
MDELTSHLLILAGALLLGAALAVVMAASNFCTLGAVADWVTTGDRRRFRAWLLAMAAAIAGAIALQSAGMFDPAATRVPYASAMFAWPRHVIGGLLFGGGMALCSGCPSKLLLRAGFGSGKAVVALLCAALGATLVLRTRFYEYVFHPWVEPVSIDLARFGLPDQRLPSVLLHPLGLSDTTSAAWLGIACAALLAIAALRWGHLRLSRSQALGAIAIGALITLGWLLTSSPLGQRWIEDAEFLLEIPPGVGVQSFTFIAPLADGISWLRTPTDLHRFTFGMAGMVGMLLGACGHALSRRRWRWDWFRAAGELLRPACGGIMLGIGGVLALGCSIGQGLTGISTLALGSLLTVIAILVGCALTIKTEYYLLVHTDRGIGAALLTAAVDLRLLPKRCRRLDKL